MEIWSIIGLGALVVVFYTFLRNLGKSLPILELLLLIAGIQWILGPCIDYSTAYEHYKYHMYVSEGDYMSFVAPAYILFSIVLLYGIKNIRFLPNLVESFSNYSSFGIRILLIGILAGLVSSIVPGPLRFIAYLFSNFKFIGSIILYFSKVKSHKSLLYLAVLFLLTESIISGMFHEFFSWMIFFYIFWCLKNKPSFSFNMVIIIFGFFCVTLLQSVKSEYRSYAWEDYSGNKGVLFFNLISNGFSVNKDLEKIEDVNTRFNQGWIISAIMANTPKNEPFANGKTVLESITVSFLPRILFPDKLVSGGRSNFMRYTGLYIGEGTAMAMSILGESYANFGIYGGILFMLIWGYLLILIWMFLIRKVLDNMVLVFFMPLIYFQVIKAETELLTVVNHLVKSIVLVFVFLWFYELFSKILSI
jgi:hypothetical protein